jgi:hypothetical protein
VKVLGSSVVVLSKDRQGAVRRYEQLFAAHPVNEFQIPGGELVVTAFAGLSVLSGSAEALARVRELRATIFVDSLKETEEMLAEAGWTRGGTLGSAGSMLARDPDGNLLEFVEEPATETSEMASSQEETDEEETC